MGITDFGNLTKEVRIRQGSLFQQVPNFVMAGQDLADGQFVNYGGEGEYFLASSTTPATHLVLKSGDRPRPFRPLLEGMGNLLRIALYRVKNDR